MIAGLVINEIGSVIGFNFPLATLPLSLFINTLIIVGAAVAYVREGKTKANLNPAENKLFSHLTCFWL